MESATAGARFTAKALSSVRATLARLRPGRSGVEKPMMPVSRTTGITGMSRRKRLGISGRNTPRALLGRRAVPSAIFGLIIFCAIMEPQI